MCDSNVASADNWFVVYNVPWVRYSFAPQQYGLFACTENGKSNNLGTFNQGIYMD